jgi:hypothetical protein
MRSFKEMASLGLAMMQDWGGHLHTQLIIIYLVPFKV